MNKKGFVFIEMIITTVVLMVALIILYNVYSNSIINEKNRMYFDDIAYVYKTETLRDIAVKNLDYSLFYANAANSKFGYVYIFSTDSDVWKTDDVSRGKENITVAKDFYGLSYFAYIKISDISKIKKCLKTSDSDTSDQKCTDTKKFIKAYAYSYVGEYLKTLDVPTDGVNTYASHDAILIGMFFNAKNGGSKAEEGNYELCIQDHVFSYYGPKNKSEKCKASCADPTISAENKKNICSECMKLYNKDDKINFDMYCENSYHLAWVYF